MCSRFGTEARADTSSRPWKPEDPLNHLQEQASEDPVQAESGLNRESRDHCYTSVATEALTHLLLQRHATSGIQELNTCNEHNCGYVALTKFMLYT